MSDPSLELSGPSMKRKRTETDEALGSGAANGDTLPTRSDTWFDDGNIVIQAQTTQFRVHKGVIARHSSVFKDVFAMPQPSGEPEIEGCAIVHVMDKPKDWENILTILYDSLKTYRSTDNMPFSMIESMLRLGKKYEFNHLWDIGMDCLRADLPQTLDLWEKKYDAGANQLGPRKDKIICHQFDLINLLFELGIKSVLPTALYRCIVQFTTEKILRGSTRGNTQTPVHLIHEAQITLLIGKEKILHARMRYLDEWYRKVDGCHNEENCCSVRALTVKDLYRHSASVFSPFITEGLWTCILCGACTSAINNRMKAGRPKVWDELPGYFGLPNWVDIKDD